jgi:uncharacterized membrane protein YsdA (DUF1294 family)/cold shock CspA family protein
MRKEGTIVRWDDARGFGFIRSRSLAQDVFVHVRDFRSATGQAPRPGLRVTFEEIHVGGKGPRAVAVQAIAASGAGGAPRTGAGVRAPAQDRHQDRRRTRRATQSGGRWVLPLMALYVLALTGLVLQRQLPWWVLPLALFLNLGTFFAYWQDKYAAQQRRWRIKEDTLHLWSLAGGWGGAWFAQQILRHKSLKASFRTTYWTTVVIHCGAVFGFCWFARAL